MATVTDAVAVLLGVCDGAKARDDQGFNALDGPLVRDILKSKYRLTEKQAQLLKKVLRKYQRQLSGHGLVWADLELVDGRGGAIERPNGQTVKKIDLAGERLLRISFPYNAEIVDVVRTLPQRRFDRQAKNWTVPVEEGDVILSKLDQFNFEVTAAARVAIEAVAAVKREGIRASRATDAEIDVPIPDGLSLLPFQRAGIAYLEDAKGRALIADEPGLGKTIQALGYLNLHPELRPAVVVCPANVKENWRRETFRWSTWKDLTVDTVSGRTGEFPKADIIIINYDILDARKDQLKELAPKAYVFDESHYLKSERAARSKAAEELTDVDQAIILLTGTPVLNRPVELWGQLQILRHDKWQKFWHFAKRYCDAHKGTYGWDFSGASNLDELDSKLRTSVMVRRTKAEVLPELPAKRRVSIPIPTDSKSAAYRRVESEAREAAKKAVAEMEAERDQLDSMDPEERKKKLADKAHQSAFARLRGVLVTEIEKVKQAAVKAKYKRTVEWVRDFLTSGKKLLLFAHHREIVNALKKEFPGSVSIIGGDSAEKRQEAVDQFQNDPNVRLMVASLMAANMGITLTAASDVAFMELGWNPATHEQAEDRTHRIGQKHSVTAWYLLAQDTIEEQIATLIDAKRHVVGAVTGDEAKQTETGIIEALMKWLTEEKR